MLPVASQASAHAAAASAAVGRTRAARPTSNAIPNGLNHADGTKPIWAILRSFQGMHGLQKGVTSFANRKSLRIRKSATTLRKAAAMRLRFASIGQLEAEMRRMPRREGRVG